MVGSYVSLTESSFPDVHMFKCLDRKKEEEKTKQIRYKHSIVFVGYQTV